MQCIPREALQQIYIHEAIKSAERAGRFLYISNNYRRDSICDSDLTLYSDDPLQEIGVSKCIGFPASP
ncbi:unnamed protein product, partial [Didymodactylos carnosus]